MPALRLGCSCCMCERGHSYHSGCVLWAEAVLGIDKCLILELNTYLNKH